MGGLKRGSRNIIYRIVKDTCHVHKQVHDHHANQCNAFLVFSVYCFNDFESTYKLAEKLSVYELLTRYALLLIFWFFKLNLMCVLLFTENSWRKEITSEQTDKETFRNNVDLSAFLLDYCTPHWSPTHRRRLFSEYFSFSLPRWQPMHASILPWQRLFHFRLGSSPISLTLWRLAFLPHALNEWGVPALGLSSFVIFAYLIWCSCAHVVGIVLMAAGILLSVL